LKVVKFYFAKIHNVPFGFETLTNARGNIFIFFPA